MRVRTYHADTQSSDQELFLLRVKSVPYKCMIPTVRWSFLLYRRIIDCVVFCSNTQVLEVRNMILKLSVACSNSRVDLFGPCRCTHALASSRACELRAMPRCMLIRLIALSNSAARPSRSPCSSVSHAGLAYLAVHGGEDAG